MITTDTSTYSNIFKVWPYIANTFRPEQIITTTPTPPINTNSWYTTITTFIITFTIYILALMLLYIAWTGIKQITTSSQSLSNSIKSPTTFNNSMNINVWLQAVKEHLNKSSISTDEQNKSAQCNF